ncbi:hypothetical protein [Sphingobacterium sp. MYb388]|uniref:hypothetical protein n=1 Tax=Sphingobacterium sp. MYb388 TaxID=2745437 RepID=UPI0030B38251
MKFIQKKGASWIVAMAILAIPGTLITSCSKDNNSAIVDSKNNKLTFSVNGIKNNDTDGAVKRMGLTSSNKKTNTNKIYSFSDVDMGVSTDNTLPVKTTSNIAGTARSNGLAADAAPGVTEDMVEGAKYIVYIYSGTTLVTAKELTAGTAGTIEGLDPAASYTWVALSYNTKDTEQPSLAPSSGSIALHQNKDVLYATGTVNLAESSNIAVLFDHMFSRIGIELNTIGVFGEITGTPTVSVSGLNLATGSIDLLNGGAVTADLANPYTPTLSYASFNRVDTLYNDAKIAYVYTASTTANQAISVSLQNLAINHVDGNVARTYFTTATPFNFSVTPELGKSHHLLLNVIESPLTTVSEGTTVKWGRSNLYDRNNNDALRGYAFYASNEQRSKANGYFPYQGLKASQFSNTLATKGDPCTRVYPAGTWKQPSVAQVNSLTSTDGLLTNILGALGNLLVADPAPTSSVGTVGGNHAQYTSTGGTTTTNAFGTSTSNSNNMRIFYNGQITNTTILTAIGQNGNGLLGLGLSNLSADLLGLNVLSTNIPVLGTSYNVAAAFWTDSPVLSGPLLTLLGTRVGYYGYYARTTTTTTDIFNTNPFIKATTTLEALNVELLGLDLLQTSFKNVRCVRAI